MTDSVRPPDVNDEEPVDPDRTWRPDPESRTLHEGPAGAERSETDTFPDPFEPAAPSAELIRRLGRYQIRRVLGSGGFGTVFEAHDEELHRAVAVKVPHADRVDSPQRMQSFLDEARHAAGLDHPSIVPVYDVGQCDGYCFVVYKLIDGCTLAQRIRRQAVDATQAARWVAEIAKALDYAHHKSVYHRDVKPGNILLEDTGKTYLSDFGVAVREMDLAAERGRAVGTIQYMSPEQVRGEGHRIDGRSDIYSLGAVLYELLTGRRPFAASTRSELREEIQYRDPRPPRQIRDGIPVELERICLKAMSKRVSDRYTTAQDMAQDLRLCVQPQLATTAPKPMPADAGEPASDPTRTPITELPAPVVPKGIRSFGAEDSEFFLDLLPGARDRTGTPDSIRFWKLRIDSRDADRAFPVGLLYGPSGCGKSSFVKAGLIPRLGNDVVAVYVEATREGTEARLLRAIRNACPVPSDRPTLVAVLSALRRDEPARPRGKKILLVIDQFEQWLHGTTDLESAELLHALRQCDGVHLQCLLLVRDDFWVAVTRFMRALEVRLVDGDNVAVADLFDTGHARKVLAAIGQAYGRLPANLADMDKDHHRFLTDAVASLARGGKVIGVQLCLFAEMLRDRPWVAATLKEVGGVAGIGVAFLEQAFHSRAANPAHRVHARAARAVLESLLTEPGSDIRGLSRTEAELKQAAGYNERPGDFAQLLDILDAQLRLITPVDVARVEVGASDPGVDAAGPKRYQLTHDYLVPAVREWMTQSRKSTWRGRAALCLESHTAEWSRDPRARRLPSLWEFVVIRLGTRVHTADQQRLMRAATRHHGWRTGWVLACALALALIGLHEFAAMRRQRSADLVRALLEASPQRVPYVLDRIADFKNLVQPQLRAEFDRQSNDDLHRLRAAVGLARLGEVESDFLTKSIALAAPGESSNIADSLQADRVSAVEALLQRMRTEVDEGVQCKYATILLQLGDSRGAAEMLSDVPRRRTAFVHGFRLWHGELEQIGNLLREIPDPATRSGLCSAISLLPAGAVSHTERTLLIRTLSDICLTARDGGTHSAARYVLQTLGAIPPAIEPSTEPQGDKRWFVNTEGITMLGVPSTITGSDDTEPLRRQLFMAATEISIATYSRFLLDPHYPVHKKPTGADLRRLRAYALYQFNRLPTWPVLLPVIGADMNVGANDDHPVQSVSWFDAVLFCNWLSWKENRRECYVPREDTHSFKDPTGRQHIWQTWAVDLDADGYRLPTELEWVRACRADSDSVFAFGDDEHLLSSYAVYARSQTSPCGRQLPNAWGFFDMHGNVREWCNDWFSASSAESTVLPPNPRNPYRVNKGGSFRSLPRECSSAERSYIWPSFRENSHIGFRVACKLPILKE